MTVYLVGLESFPSTIGPTPDGGRPELAAT